MSNTPLSDECVAIIAAGYAQRSDVTQDQIIDFIARLRGNAMVQTAGKPLSVAVPEGRRKAAMPPEESVTRNQIFCLCCGKGFKMLKRHLGAEHNMTEEEYRAAFDLPASMPLVAPSYSERKAEYARKAGLGTYSRERADTSRGAS